MSYRYIGNKTRLVPSILEVIREMVPEGAKVADPMCGTAAMSVGLRDAGYKVIASDILTFASQHATVRLCLNAAPSFNGVNSSYQEALDKLSSADPLKGLFFNEYSPGGSPAALVPPRKYLTEENAGRVDAILAQLDSWRPMLTPVEDSLLRHDLVLAVNRVANIAGTYGHFRSTFGPSALKALELRPTQFDANSEIDNIVMQGSIESLAPQISADACYLDPPYMKRQYAANYHLLETIARGDTPVPVGISGLRDWWDQYSDFCSKRKIEKAFARTIEGMNCKKFFISYSEDGLMSQSQMMEIFSKFGTVELREFRYKRFKSNAGGSGGFLNEQLYIVTKP